MAGGYLSQAMIRTLGNLALTEFSLAPFADPTMLALERRGYAEKRVGDRKRHGHRWYPTEAGKAALLEYIGETK